MGRLGVALFGTSVVWTPMQSHTHTVFNATKEARAVATSAEAQKRESKSYIFVPVAIETSGALDPDRLSLTLEGVQQAIILDHQSL